MNTKQNMILLWLANRWGINPKEAYEGNQYVKKSIEYNLLEIKYEFAPISLEVQRKISKLTNWMKKPFYKAG